MGRKTTRPDPWDRLPEETNPAWEAFVVYRDLGLQRSHAKAGQRLGKNRTSIATWSKKFSWSARCAAWDQEQDRLWQIDLRVKRREAAERNIATASAAMKVAGQGLMKLAQDPDGLKAQDVARLMEVASRVEALALGAATEIHGTAPAGEGAAALGHVAALTDEDRRARMLQLRRELDSRLDADEETA